MDTRYESTLPAAESAVETATPQSPERFHALDAVRGFALMLGIVFHSTMSFLNAPQHAWLIVDKDPSTTLSVLFYVLHMFRMATFFFIAGFFARLLFHRRGQRAFVRDRLRRIGLPLVVGWPFLFASIVGCAIWGAWVMNGGTLPAEPPSDDFIMRNAMDAQEVAIGWWPGDTRYGKAAFYAYAHPAPEGFPVATLSPDAARWEPSLGEFILDWDDVRSAPDPAAAALDFARSAFQHACLVCEWDPALPASAAGKPPPVA